MARRSRLDNPYIVFSWSGLFYILFIIIVFFFSRYRTTNGNLWVMGVSLIVIGIMAMIQTNDNMRHVSLELLPSPAVPEGDEVLVHLRLINRSSQNRYAFSVAFQKFRKKRWPEAAVLAQSEAKAVLALPPQKRGIVPIPPLLAWSFFPFGLCLSWKRLQPSGYVVVYPRPEGESLAHQSVAGERNLLLNGVDGIDDVTGLRRYQHGDAPSAVDWRLFARRGTLFVRSRDGGEGGDLDLTWERTEFLEETEARLRQLSRWIHDCCKAGIPFRLRLLAPTVYSHRNLEECFEALARFPEEIGA